MISPKKIIILIIGILSFSISWSQEYKRMMHDENYTVQQVQEEAEKYFSNRDKGRGSGYKQYKRWEYPALQKMDEKGYLKKNSFYIDELKRYNNYVNRREKNAQLNDYWEELGPKNWNNLSGWNPGVGRLTSIAIDKKNTSHIIVGSNNGGIWKSTDRGNTWTPLTDDYNNLAVHSLAMDPNNSSIYYWGSSYGKIYKSTDSGSTWQEIAKGNVANGTVNKIRIPSNNSNVIYVTSNNIYSMTNNSYNIYDYHKGHYNRDNGVYKSVDGGLTWKHILVDGNPHDIEFNTNNSDILYVSGEKFSKSTNQGENFTTIGDFSYGAKKIAVSEADPYRIYVIEDLKKPTALGGKFNGFYVSTDGGDTFVKKNHGNKNYLGYTTYANDGIGQSPDNMDIASSPIDADEVHIAGIITWKSTDGGDSFNPSSDWTPQNAKKRNLGYCHADINILEFVGQTLLVCSDGGLYVAENTKDININYYKDLSSGLGIRAFNRLGVSQKSPVVISGGSLDCGVSLYTPNKGWNEWLGSDGTETFVDKTDSNILYGSTTGGDLYRTLDQGVSVKNITPEGAPKNNSAVPFEQDPTLVNTIYVGYRSVYKSSDKGTTWKAISPDFGKSIEKMKIAPSDNNIIYISLRDRLFKRNHSSSWVELTGFKGSINSIAIHPKDSNKIAIATTDTDKVFVSTDGGANWKSYLKNLPHLNAICLVWQDNDVNSLYLGMNYGVYYIDDNHTEWENFNNNLPNAMVNELEINPAENKIYAATYGRGCWSSPLFGSSLSISENNNALNSIKVYPNPTTDIINLQWDEKYQTTIRLFNSLGEIVYYRKNSMLNDKHQINISTYAVGTYFLKMSNKKGTIIKKIVKQ